jgi:hypothetical protein
MIHWLAPRRRSVDSGRAAARRRLFGLVVMCVRACACVRACVHEGMSECGRLSVETPPSLPALHARALAPHSSASPAGDGEELAEVGERRLGHPHKVVAARWQPRRHREAVASIVGRQARDQGHLPRGRPL